jgi:hypothetical protein
MAGSNAKYRKIIDAMFAENAELFDEFATIHNKYEKDAKKSSDKKSTEKTTGATEVSSDIKANVADAISSRNTAALESYMGDSVKVIIAASEGIGDRTPAQAVADLNYLSSATDPWDFDLPEATIDDWQTGDYASYFPETLRVIGRSSDGYVVVFKFNSSEKITDILWQLTTIYFRTRIGSFCQLYAKFLLPLCMVESF